MVSGFKYFGFSPRKLRKDPILTCAYFSTGLVQPPTSCQLMCLEMTQSLNPHYVGQNLASTIQRKEDQPNVLLAGFWAWETFL